MEKTTCYKCDTEIEVPSGSVHALCSDCQTDFDAWFTAELATLDKKVGK